MNKVDIVHVRGTWGDYSNSPMWWPVNGPLHEDPELDFPYHHFHIDARYIPPKRWDRILKAFRGEVRRIRQTYHYSESYSAEEAVYHQLAATPLMAALIAPRSINTTIIDHVTDRDTKLGYNLKERSRLSTSALSTFPEQEWKRVNKVEAFRPMKTVPRLSGQRSQLKRWHNVPLDLNKMVCPHRGADLSGIEPEDGLITCPLHGLRFCAKTGLAMNLGTCSSDHANGGSRP